MAARERLHGPALLSAIRSRMSRNYCASAGRAAAFQAAKGDVFLLMCEIETMLAAEGAARLTEVAEARADAAAEADQKRSDDGERER